jgi:hypothetical protein
MVLQPVQVPPLVLLLAAVLLLVLAPDDEDPVEEEPVDDDPLEEEPVDDDAPVEEEPVDEEPVELDVVGEPLDVVLVPPAPELELVAAELVDAELWPDVEPCVAVDVDRAPPPPPAAPEPLDPQPMAADPSVKRSTPIAAKGSRKAMQRLSAPNLGAARATTRLRTRPRAAAAKIHEASGSARPSRGTALPG